MNMQSELTEQQLIQICGQIILSSPQVIADNEWVFLTKTMPLPLVYQSFIIEFTKQYISDINYRRELHILCSEVYQANQN